MTCKILANLPASLFLLIGLLNANCVAAQNTDTMHDTLSRVIVVADTIKARPAGLVKVNMPQIRRIVTAMGEGDVIKYIQTMPGISTGVEGSSSFYVRGGNLGNNVVTLDGVRLYGYGHLLGITSAFSNDIVGDVAFNVGGFDAESYNLLASHIKVTTKEPNFKEAQGRGSISNFMVGGYAAAPIVKDKLAVILSARISPLKLEYNLGKDMLENTMKVFDDVVAGVYDVYGKATYKISDSHKLNASVFYSIDDFGYGAVDRDSYDEMKWHNLIGNLQWDWRIADKWSLKTNLSYNDYGSSQKQEKRLEGTYNAIGVQSKINEMSFNSVVKYAINTRWNARLGVRGTGSDFAPGSTKVYGEDSGAKGADNSSENFLGTAYGEIEYTNADKARIMLAVRGNMFMGDIVDKFGGGKEAKYDIFNPEFSFAGSVRLCKWMGIEVTVDKLVQHYHTLEGIPLGWSLDMIVPSSNTLKPEESIQYYGGMYFKYKNHRFSAGAYYKELDNLIYFSRATNFFSSQMGSWKSYIEVGKGESKGLEFLYEKTGEKLNYKVAYTRSKTTRDFEGVNEGRTFLAKFDRPHILNVTADYLIKKEENREFGANLLFTYQSGNMESVKSATYIGHLPGWDKEIILDYYSSINNLRLEDYIRLDIGVYGQWKKPKVTHNALVGIYNVMNRHNIFSLYYNTDDKLWKKVYIFPLMPSISYSVEF